MTPSKYDMDLLKAIKNISTSLNKIERKITDTNNTDFSSIGFINNIFNLCKEHNCAIDICIGVDGAMTFTVYGKRNDFVTIGVDWSEDLIKGALKDCIRRANE